MQYVIDTLNVEIARLHKTIRSLKARVPTDGEEERIHQRINEFEGNIRELRKAIGVLKEYVRSSSTGSQYQSRYMEPPPPK